MIEEEKGKEKRGKEKGERKKGKEKEKREKGEGRRKKRKNTIIKVKGKTEELVIQSPQNRKKGLGYSILHDF
ncbi:MAG: hypothetical protein K6A82_04970 [Prevotella sp.]|nr:hypothetical protein [Prevotella sp.]